MENGVWRTVGGRRIFIKDGQSLSDAMKESGKFKKGEKYKNKNGAKIEIDDYTKDGQPQYKDNSGEIRKASDDESLKRILDDNGYAKQEDYKPSDDEIGFNPREAVDYYLKKGDFDKADELIDDYALEDEREEFIDGLNSKAAAEYKKYRNSKDMIEKYMNIPEEERVKAAEEGKNWKDLVKEKEKSELHKKLEKDMGEELVEHTNDKGDKWYSSKSLDDEEKEFRDKYEKESSTKDIKVSGPDSDMIIEDFEDKVLSNYDEPLTQSEKKQQIDKFVQKYQAQGEPMKNISTQDMKEVLYDNYKIQDDSNKTMNDSIREKAEKTNAKKEEAKTYMQDQYKAFDKGDISGAELEQAKKDSGLSKQEIEEARRYVNDRAPESYPRATENKTGNTTSQAVPKASKTTEQDTLTNEYNKTDSRGSMSDDAFIEQARKVGMSDENIAKEVYKKHNGPESNNTSDNNIKRLLAKQKKEESLAKGDKDTASRFEKYEKEFESRTKTSESSKTNGDDRVKTLSGKYETDNKGREVTQKEYDEFRQAYKDGKISQEDYRNDNYDALKNITENKTAKTEAKNYMQDQFKAFDKGNISGADLEKAKRDSGLSKQEIEEARNYVNNRAPESYPRQTENKSGKTTSQAVPKKSTLNTMTEKNADIAEKIIEDDEWNDIRVTRYGNGNTVIENERTGKNIKITPSDTKESLNKKIEDSYKESKNSNDWVRNAFNDYKKEHPNTKMTLEQFKKSKK